MLHSRAVRNVLVVLLKVMGTKHGGCKAEWMFKIRPVVVVVLIGEGVTEGNNTVNGNSTRFLYI